MGLLFVICSASRADLWCVTTPIRSCPTHEPCSCLSIH